jgi:hypothetical protein
MVVVGPAPVKPPPIFEIAPLGGIQFLGSVDTTGGDLDVGFSSVWGAALAVHVAGIMPELSYTFQPTSLSFEPFNGPSQKLFSMSVHHILAGVAAEFPVSKTVQPFVGIALGIGIFAPHGGQISDDVRFASAIYGGSEFVITPNIGIRLQARLVSSFFDTGSTVFCTAFAGCSFGLLSSGVTQLGFMVGPTFKF